MGRYKRINALFAASVICLTTTLAHSRTAAVKTGGLTTYVSGSSSMVVGGRTVPLKTRQLVGAGYRIRTGSNGRVELTFRDGSRLRIGSNSDYYLIRHTPQATFAKLDKGRVWGSGKGKGKRVTQGKHATCAVMGTIYDFDVLPNKTKSTVFEGTVGIHRPMNITEENMDDVLQKTPDLKKPEPPTNHSGEFKPPTVIESPVHEIPSPVQVVPGPYEVSMEEWLQIVENQQIEMDENGKAQVSEIDPQALQKLDEWVRWNREMDKKPVNLEAFESE